MENYNVPSRKRDLGIVLTDGCDDAAGIAATIRKGIADYLDLLVQIRVCIETKRVPDDIMSYGFEAFDLFRCEMQDLADGLEKYKDSVLISA